MKKLLTIFVVITLFAALFIGLGTFSASAATEGNYTYEVSDGEATITDVNTSISGDITIPSTLGGYPVTGIGDYAFSGCTGLTSVTFGNGVKSIGDSAFFGCTGLTSFVVDSGNTAYSSSNGVLFNKSKTTLVAYPAGKEGAFAIPNGVTSIGSSAFYDCESLTSVTIPDSVTSIGDVAFCDCESLTSVTIGNGVTSIGEYAFSDCTGLTSVTIPDSVTSIGERAFYYCTGLTSVTIPNSVTGIGYEAFSRCTGLTSVTIGNGVKSIADWAFEDCTGLTSVTIGNGVTSIGNYAFVSCKSLTSVTIPNSVTSIGDYAFGYCSGLTSVTIGNDVESIGDSAFNWCTGLTDVWYAGDDRSAITIGLFNSPLTEAVWHYGVEIVDSHVYYAACDTTCNVCSVTRTSSTAHTYANSCDTTCNVCGHTRTISHTYTNAYDTMCNVCATTRSCDAYVGTQGYLTYRIVPNENGGTVTITKCDTAASGALSVPSTMDGQPVTAIAGSAFNGCSMLIEIVVPDGVTSIGYEAFLGCTGLTSVTIPDSVTSIGGWVFEGCTGLTSVTIGNGVKSIGDGVFDKCTGLTSVTIGNGVTSIGNYAFRDCTGLTSVTIPDSVTSIGGSAFRRCTGLTSVTIGNGVKSIGERAFFGCTGLTSVTIPNSVTSIGSSAFYKCTGLTSVTIGNGVTSIGDSAFRDCTGLTSVTIPDSVTSISSSAFRYCTGLTSVTISNSVTSIGDYAFYECESLTSVTIGNGVKSIGSSAFLGCKKLTNVWYAGDDRSAITIGSYNSPLTKVVWHYGVDIVGEHVYDKVCDSICNLCGATRTALAHKYTTTTTKATLSANGKKVTKCSVCGKTSSTTTIYRPYTFKLSATSYTYNGAVKKPTVTVKDAAGKTISSSNYTVTYASGRKNAGTYTVKVTMKGNYSGTKTLSFKINPINISKCSVKLSATSYTYNGAVKKPTVTVKNANGTKLTKDTHYTVTYASGRKNAGTYKVTVKMKGNYTGSKTLTFKINPINVSKCELALSATKYTYDGKSKIPVVFVLSPTGTKLTESSYTVTYASGRKNVGIYKVTVKMKGNYTGSKTLTFKINPAKTTISKVTPATKSLKVAITKKSTQVTGYQVQYSTSKSFSSSKTVTISSYKTTSTTIKSLKAKTTYYVRVRTYKTVNGVKYYSGWSTVKSAKTK